jgi:APA family basic amino acid/polyamine antiporter
MHRDDGLIRGIGTAGLTANIVNGVVGAGIFTLPAAVALAAGALAPLAYLLCAVIMAGVVICFAEAGSRVPTSGGAYGTVEAAFGPAAGFVTGMLLIVSDVLASGGLASALADMLGSVAPPMASAAGRMISIGAIYGLLAWANLIGVGATARLITGATALKLLPLIGFLGIALWAFHLPAPPSPATPPPHLAGFGRALILTLFAFEGMETALMASGEVRTPNRTVPRALLGAMLFVLALYLGVQLGAQHLLGADLAHQAAPLAEAAGRIIPAARPIMLAGAGVSMLAWCWEHPACCSPSAGTGCCPPGSGGSIRQATCRRAPFWCMARPLPCWRPAAASSNSCCCRRSRRSRSMRWPVRRPWCCAGAAWLSQGNRGSCRSCPWRPQWGWPAWPA